MRTAYPQGKNPKNHLPVRTINSNLARFNLFIMKVINSYILRSACALLIGILLAANPEEMTGLIVQIIGALFILSGLMSLISWIVISYTTEKGLRPVFPLIGLGSFLFGVVLGFWPALFIMYLMYIFGGLMVLGAVNQLWNMFRLRKLIPFRWYSLLLTLVILALGLLVLFYPLESASLPFLILGINFIIYGTAELVSGVRWRKYERMRRKAEAEAKAEDAVILIEDNNK